MNNDLSDSRENINYNTLNYNNHRESIKIFQPKLLQLKRNTITSSEIKDSLLHSKLKSTIQKRNTNIEENSKSETINKRTKSKLEEKLEHFYKNPFKYMDYLIERNLKVNKSNEKTNLDPLKVLLKEFESFGNKTKEDIIKVIEIEIKKLEKPLKKIKPIILSNVLNAEEIKSEPIAIDQEMLLALINNKNEFKFESVINTRTDIKNFILKDNYSSLSKDSVLRKTLDCLKGDTIEIPKENFLQVKDLNITNINITEMQYTKNIINLQRQFECIKDNADKTMLDNIEKTAVKEQQIFNNLMQKSNQCVNKMEEHTKVSEEMLTHINRKLNEEFNKDLVSNVIKQFSVRVDNLDRIKKDLNCYQEEEQNIARNLERLKIIEENNKKAESEIKLFLKKEGIEDEEIDINMNGNGAQLYNDELSDKEIDKLYNKFKKHDIDNANKKKKINSCSYNDKYRSNSKKVIRPTTNMINHKYK